MMTVRKSCNLGYFHLAHSTMVMLLNENGAMSEPAAVFCGGTQPEEIERAKNREG